MRQDTIKVGIVGGAGYTAGELLRILLRHPNTEIVFVNSSSNAGKPIAAVHTDLIGETAIIFTSDLPVEDIEVLFLCMGHGRSKTFLTEYNLPPNLKVIDLSRDFRLKSANHSFIYGLPELNKIRIQESQFVANCGCFATAIQLALLPLAKAQLLQDDVHIHAITGSTGAGQSPGATTHFSWRNNNVSIYKAFQHQHLDEIRQSLLQLQPDHCQSIHFLPIRGNFTRGIFASTYMNTSASLEVLQNLYSDYYRDEPFVHLSSSNPNLKQVINTNKCVLYLEEHEGKILIISMIDNLIKGASGQAVQNMNLMVGLEEEAGLSLKAVAF